MAKLRDTKGVIKFTTSGGASYDVAEDGTVEVQEAHVAEMTHPVHGFVRDGTHVPGRVLSKAERRAKLQAELAALGDADDAEDEGGDDDKGGDDPFAGMTKADLREWLDERDVEYDNKASKDELLALARSSKE